MVPYVLRYDPLAKVCLEAVYADIEQLDEVRLPPLFRSGIGKVYRRTSRLPDVGLERAPVDASNKVAFLVAFAKQSRRLTDPGVDPHTHLDAPFV